MFETGIHNFIMRGSVEILLKVSSIDLRLEKFMNFKNEYYDSIKLTLIHLEIAYILLFSVCVFIVFVLFVEIVYKKE